MRERVFRQRDRQNCEVVIATELPVRSTLDEFTRELDELKTLVASITPFNAALDQHQDSLVQQYVVVRRRFDNAAFAVALYASFEKFIEGLVAEYTQFESRRLEYKN
jgi:hypothetical protein